MFLKVEGVLEWINNGLIDWLGAVEDLTGRRDGRFTLGDEVGQSIDRVDDY